MSACEIKGMPFELSSAHLIFASGAGSDKVGSWTSALQHLTICQLCAGSIPTLSNTRSGKAKFAVSVSEGACQVANVGNELAAFGIMTDHFFGQSFIELLVVGVPHRRAGIGLALVSNFQVNCHGRKLFTSTNLSNRPMQRLLLKAGFSSSGFIENLDEGDPELVFFYQA